MKGLHMAAWILLVVGGLNWLLFALAGTDIGAWLGGMNTGAAQTVYVLVGLAALYELFTHKKGCRSCNSSGM